MFIFLSKLSGQKLKALIELCKTGGTRTTKISQSDLAALPPFLRFNIVDINVAPAYILILNDNDNDTQPIAANCLLFENLLQSIKPALAGSKLSFYGIIDESKSACFRDHLELLNYVRDRLLTICDKSREYEFGIVFDSDESAAQHVITSILETSQLNHCSNAQFRIYYGSDELELQLRLPIKEISNWLHRKCDRGRKKSLHIYSFRIENFEEMFNHLKEVLLLYKILNVL